MSERKVYLEDVPLEQALKRFLGELQAAGALQPLPGEWLELDGADGRVCAADVWARTCSPHYHACAVDGYAVRAADCAGASEAHPVRLRPGEQALAVNTGQELPAGTDAVIMVEKVARVPGPQGTVLEITDAVAPWQNVRTMGEDLVAGELVLPENHLLQPADLGAIAAAGHERVLVRRRPRVAVIPTGDELKQPGAELRPGDIVEFNSITLAASLRRWGARAERLPAVADDPSRLHRALAAACRDYDLVVVNAGSSAGSRDHTAAVIEELGRVLVHGIAIRPGHPVVLGMVAGKPVLGIPGYPVSALLALQLLARPILAAWQGRPVAAPRLLRAQLARKLYSPLGMEEFVRVCLGRVGQRLVAVPLARGAGVITSLARANGLLRIPAGSEGVAAGGEVAVELLRPEVELENTIMCIGSHDPVLDLLAAFLARAQAGVQLFAAHVGSTAGLRALAAGQAHLAGCHLLDAESGEYNLAAVRRLLAGREVVLLGFLERVQGLMVPAGNPRGITGLADLARDGVRFINRQRGAGTRVLLDFQLGRLGISPADIDGYQRQAGTHLAVAVAVQSGAADCGLGVLAAARALGLDFIEVARERYDLVIPAEYFTSPLLEPLLAVVRSDEFRAKVESLGGYGVENMGRVLHRVLPDGTLAGDRRGD
ncbi:MAG: molybdopterin biosynthesis protein [Deltaproteobacteria bacterium]|nr:MAG: molybdopterin biosynthesis protein [Deltaproteobacteria bacterium]